MTWFVLLAAVSVAGFLAYDRHTTCVALIEGELRRQHAQRIRTSFQWADFDRDNFTYEVEYVDATGKACRTSCKVRGLGIPGDDKIYWASPI